MNGRQVRPLYFLLIVLALLIVHDPLRALLSTITTAHKKLLVQRKTSEMLLRYEISKRDHFRFVRRKKYLKRHERINLVTSLTECELSGLVY